MNLLLRLAAVSTLLSLTACLSFPTDRASLREAQPNPVTFNFDGPISEVTSAIVESAKECGSRWRESMLGMVAAPPRFDVRLSDQTASKSVVEIWSMNALSPDYMYELFALRSTDTGTELTQYQGKAHEGTFGSRARNVGTWYPAGSPNCG